jgi:dsRNA-specific ribonuclease
MALFTVKQPNSPPADALNAGSTNPHANSKGQLQEFCQKNQLLAPTYHIKQYGHGADTRFDCSVGLKVKGKEYAASVVGLTTKKLAEHAAAAEVLKTLTGEVAPKPQLAGGIKVVSAINRLQEHFQNQYQPLPVYETKTVPAKSPEFICTVRFGTEHELTATGAAGSKMGAKTQAAWRALQQLGVAID